MTTSADARQRSLPVLSLVVLTSAFLASGIGAYALNPVLAANDGRNTVANDLGIQVFFINVEASNEPVVRLHVDQSGATLRIEIDPGEGVIDFGEIAVARATGTTDAIGNTPLECTTVPNMWTDAGNLTEDKAGETSTVDADDLYRQQWSEQDAPHRGTQVHGSMTVVHFPENQATVRIACPIPDADQW